MNEIAKSSVDKVLTRIYSNGRGWVFTPIHFKDLAGTGNIAIILHRLHEKGTIRKLDRGLYDYPKTDPDLGPLEPSADRIIKALTEGKAVRVQPSGAYAANLLGLSTQMPMQIVYLTDGVQRKVQVGKRQIILREASPRNMKTTGKTSGLIIQALRYLGKQRVDENVVRQIDRQLDEKTRKQLKQDLRYAPGWIADILRKLIEPKRVTA